MSLILGRGRVSIGTEALEESVVPDCVTFCVKYWLRLSVGFQNLVHESKCTERPQKRPIAALSGIPTSIKLL